MNDLRILIGYWMFLYTVKFNTMGVSVFLGHVKVFTLAVEVDEAVGTMSRHFSLSADSWL